MIALVIALAAAAPAPVAAPSQPPAKSVPASPATKVTAASLARAVAPEDLMVPLQLDQTRKALLAFPEMDEDANALERDYPGIWAAVWTAIEPEMRRWLESENPIFWAALERMYVDRLTEREAQALLTFYRSPTGQKLIRGMAQNVDARPVFKEIVAAPDADVTAEQLDRVTGAARSKTVSQIGREDMGELLILMHYIDRERFRSVATETQRITLEFVNRKDPEGDERLQQLIEDTIDRYKRAHPIAARRK